MIDVAAVRAARIVDTLHCSERWVTDAVCRELRDRADISVGATALALHGEDGDLLPFDAA